MENIDMTRGIPKCAQSIHHAVSALHFISDLS